MIKNVELFINYPDSPSSLFKKVYLKHNVDGDTIKFELSDWQRTVAEHHGITLRYTTDLFNPQREGMKMLFITTMFVVILFAVVLVMMGNGFAYTLGDNYQKQKYCQTDYSCVNQCVASGYLYGLCRSQCTWCQ